MGRESENNKRLMLEEGMIFVDIEKLPDLDFQKTESGILLAPTSQVTPHRWRDCKIVVTSDENKYPVGSKWIMGEEPGTKIEYHGDYYTLISTRNLKARHL